jgi:hypothetical protein
MSDLRDGLQVHERRHSEDPFDRAPRSADLGGGGLESSQKVP